jgi:hypothetical protein
MVFRDVEACVCGFSEPPVVGDGATLRRYSFSLLGFLRGLGVA